MCDLLETEHCFELLKYSHVIVCPVLMKVLMLSVSLIFINNKCLFNHQD